MTCRTLQRRLLFTPTPEFNDQVRGALARALHLYPIELHAYVMMSNHYHMILTAPDQSTLSRFLGHFHASVARVVDRVNSEWSGKVWGKRSVQIPISDEPAAQIERLRYVLAHGCKEGLVSSPRDWPGISSTNQLLGAGTEQGTWRDRGALWDAENGRSTPVNASEFESDYDIQLTPLPCWRDETRERHASLIADMVAQIEVETAERERTTKRPIAGVAAVEDAKPRSARSASRRRVAPIVHAVSRAIRQEVRDAYQAFVRVYREAAMRLARGEQGVVFPPGCYPPRPPASAWLDPPVSDPRRDSSA